MGLPPGVIPDGGFDVVTAWGCLTCGARTKEEFFQELKNIRTVLKVGDIPVCIDIWKDYKIASEDKSVTPYRISDRQ